ncbi:lytic murein transglycosylase [Desulfobacterales bacterium HSG16]|nr:lytic murein transglycosylase [Desulfobacterales bacterium HSG16]
MENFKSIKKNVVLSVGLSSLLIILMFSNVAIAAEKKFDYFSTLQKRLVKDGFIKKGINALYKKPQVSFDTKGVSLYFVHTESKLNYNQFLDQKNIKKARAYMKKYKKELAFAQKTYGVDKEVITGIALVETRLGTYVGKRMVINILSSMSALSEKKVREKLWADIKDRTELTKKKFEAKAAKKAGWAYKELKAFLNYTTKEKINPLNINGSYAGAMGICQFMPSNILPLAKDGNGDGKINLFDHADAVASIANYLKRYGWKPGLTQKQAFKAVYSYNHSKYYVNTVLKIAKALKAKPKS